MQVVEDQHERLRPRELLQQRADGAVQAVALVAAGRPGQRREDVDELGARGVVEVRQAARVEAVQVLVERVDEDAERQVALELGRAAGQDEAALGVGARLELGQQPGLAHPRLAEHLDRDEPAAGALQRRVQRFELGAAPDQRLSGMRHP